MNRNEVHYINTYEDSIIKPLFEKGRNGNTMELVQSMYVWNITMKTPPVNVC
jgi:hypothetical protein